MSSPFVEKQSQHLQSLRDHRKEEQARYLEMQRKMQRKYGVPNFYDKEDFPIDNLTTWHTTAIVPHPSQETSQLRLSPEQPKTDSYECASLFKDIHKDYPCAHTAIHDCEAIQSSVEKAMNAYHRCYANNDPEEIHVRPTFALEWFHATKSHNYYGIPIIPDFSIIDNSILLYGR